LKDNFWLNSSKRAIDVTDVDGSIVWQYNMLYREFACNCLLSAVFDYAFWGTHYFLEDDRDGSIISISTLQKTKTEHVMAYKHWAKHMSIEEIESLIENTIIGKLKYWGSYNTGKSYLKDTVLVVNIQFPHDLSYDIVSIIRMIMTENPTFIPEIYLILVNREHDSKHYTFNVTHVDLKID